MKAPSRIRQTLLYLTCQSYMKGSDETWFVYTCQHVWSKPIINNWAIIINKTGRTCPNVFFFSTIINNWAIIINKTGCTCPNFFFFSALQDARFSAEAEIWEEGQRFAGESWYCVRPRGRPILRCRAKKHSQAEALIVKASVLASWPTAYFYRCYGFIVVWTNKRVWW